MQVVGGEATGLAKASQTYITAAGSSTDSTVGTITVQIFIDNEIVTTNKGGGGTSTATASYEYSK